MISAAIVLMLMAGPVAPVVNHTSHVELAMAYRVVREAAKSPICKFYFETILAHSLEQLLDSDIEIVLGEPRTSDGRPAWAMIVCGKNRIIMNEDVFIARDFKFMAAVIIHELAHIADCKEGVFMPLGKREAGELAERACVGSLRRPTFIPPFPQQ